MSYTYYRYFLKYVFTNIDGNPRHEEKRLDWDDDPIEAYHRQVGLNDRLLGGATVTDVRLVRVKITKEWEDVTPVPTEASDWFGYDPE